MALSTFLTTLFHRRRPARHRADHCFAVYWTGGVAHPRPLRELSLSGAVIETPETGPQHEWYPGTLVHMVLQRSNGGGPSAGDSCGVWARVSRRIGGAICVAFAPRDRAEFEALRRFVSGLDEPKKRRPDIPAGTSENEHDAQ